MTEICLSSLLVILAFTFSRAQEIALEEGKRADSTTCSCTIAFTNLCERIAYTHVYESEVYKGQQRSS